MNDKVKRFEIFVLRPLQATLILSGIALLFGAHWVWSGACVLGVFRVGIIGAKLHPLQSARQLSAGPLTSSGALVESELLSPAAQNTLVDHACVQVGMLVGVIAGICSWAGLGWHWYFALLVAWPAMLFSGALLKIGFQTI